MTSKHFKPGEYLLVGITVLIVISSCASCKKMSSANHNELKATVRFISGETIEINSRGADADMFCYSGFTIENDRYPSLSLQTFSYFDCTIPEGTYSGKDFWCSFKKDMGTQSPLYSNMYGSSAGTITFTSFTETNVACHFYTICKNGANDSVIIQGTFKGDYMSH